MVTLSAATSGASALHAAVRAVRAAVERPIGATGVLTIALVMLTIRPNFLACMPGRTARISIRAGSMLALIAESQAASSQLAK